MKQCALALSVHRLALDGNCCRANRSTMREIRERRSSSSDLISGRLSARDAEEFFYSILDLDYSSLNSTNK